MLKENCIYIGEDNCFYLVLGYRETPFFQQKTFDGVFNDCYRIMKYTPVKTAEQLRKEVILEDMTDVAIIQLGDSNEDLSELLKNPIPFNGSNFDYVYCECQNKKVDIDEEIVKQWILKTQLVNSDFRYYYNNVCKPIGIKETYKKSLELYKERFKDLFAFFMHWTRKDFSKRPVQSVKPYHLYYYVENTFNFYVISISEYTFIYLGSLITLDMSLFNKYVINLQGKTLCDTGVTCEFLKGIR